MTHCISCTGREGCAALVEAFGEGLQTGIAPPPPPRPLHASGVGMCHIHALLLCRLQQIQDQGVILESLRGRVLIERYSAG